jgi:hypothetical protein
VRLKNNHLFPIDSRMNTIDLMGQFIALKAKHNEFYFSILKDFYEYTSKQETNEAVMAALKERYDILIEVRKDVDDCQREVDKDDNLRFLCSLMKKTFEEPEFVENKIEEISESIGDERLPSETTTENAEEAT